MSDTILPPYLANVPIGTLAANGNVVPSAYFIRWLNQSLTDRIGGTSSPSLPSVSADLDATNANVESLQTETANLEDEVNALGSFPTPDPLSKLDDPDSRLASLEALVANLADQISGLQQGTTP